MLLIQEWCHDVIEQYIHGLHWFGYVILYQWKYNDGKYAEYVIGNSWHSLPHCKR